MIWDFWHFYEDLPYERDVSEKLCLGFYFILDDLSFAWTQNKIRVRFFLSFLILCYFYRKMHMDVICDIFTPLMSPKIDLNGVDLRNERSEFIFRVGV